MDDHFIKTALSLFAALFAGTFVLNFLYLLQVKKLLKCLEDKHPKIWEGLGRPSLFMNNSPSNGMKILSYIRNKDYELAGDPELTRIGARARYMLAASIPLIGALIAIFAAIAYATWNARER